MACLFMGSKRDIEIEGDTPLFDESMKKAQRAAKSGTWKTFKEVFEKDKKGLLQYFDLFGNTPLHVAHRSNDPKLLRDLLEMLPENQKWVALRKGNRENNTILHEVIFSEKVEMADVIFDFEKKVEPSPEEENDKPEEKEEKKRPLLELKNEIGETPLFRAAKYGKLKMLKHMAKHIGDDKRRHFRNETHNILHASILWQCFAVAIWIMMSMDENLALEKDDGESTCLQLLSRMPAAFWSTNPMKGLKWVIYKLLPEEGYEEIDEDLIPLFRLKRDLESGPQENAKLAPSVLSRINYAVWKLLATVFKGITHIWEIKKSHKLVDCLTELLVKKDLSWQISNNEKKKTLIKVPSIPSNIAKRKRRMEIKEEKEYTELRIELECEKKKRDNYTPLLIAASTGIEEIVRKILEVHPEAIDHVSPTEENILHMAVMHRQLKIFELIKEKKKTKAELWSLTTRISTKNRTILHQVARMDYYRGVDRAGAAFQLQDELNWYKRVETITPFPYYMHCDKDNLTAGDVLDIEHDNMLRDAQNWIKQTAESCSTVAVLIATVVFAAAYTIPGGIERGTPVLLHSAEFIFFTIMDVVALVFSLASVVMFLSILTSPYELWDFHSSLPRKLSIGFAFLFLSLTTTMLAFSATILLTIRLQWKDWTSTLIYSAAFFPVTIFGLIEFPLYKIIPGLLKSGFQKFKEVGTSKERTEKRN